MWLAAEQAAPWWVPAIAFLIPAVIVTAVTVPALRLRRRAKRTRRAQTTRHSADTTPLASAASIDDPSGHSADAILKALAVKPEDHGPTGDGMPHDEGWAGTMLGLRSRISSSSSVLEPHVYWGTREGRQVFVRLGPDEKLEGGTTMFSNRHIRSITVLRVASPRFDLVAHHGRLEPSKDAPAEVRDVVSRLTADDVTWADARVTGGPNGIVAARSTIDGIASSWAYDLWLCEHLARSLGLQPLKPARVGPKWKVPYGLGRSRTPSTG